MKLQELKKMISEELKSVMEETSKSFNKFAISKGGQSSTRDISKLPNHLNELVGGTFKVTSQGGIITFESTDSISKDDIRFTDPGMRK